MFIKVKNNSFSITVLLFICFFVSCSRDFIPKIPIQFQQTFIPSANRIELIFDRADFDLQSAKNINNYKVALIEDKTLQEIKSVSVIDNRLAITFKKNLISSKGYGINIYNVTDTKGVPMAYSEQLITFKVATVKFKKATVTPPNIINLTFNRELDEKAINTENFLLKTGNKTLKPDQVSVKYKDVSLTFKQPFENGDYVLTMTNIKAVNLAVISNKNYVFTYNGVIINENLPTQWFYFNDIELQNSTNTLYIDWDKGNISKFNEDIEYELFIHLDRYYANIEGYYKGKLFGLMVLDKNIKDVKDIAPYIDKFYRSTGREERISSSEPYGYNYNNLSPYYLHWCIVDVDDPFALNYNIERYHLPLYNNKVKNQYDSIYPFKIIPNRTIIFKTNRGKYGKMEITGLYKNNQQPDMIPYNYVYNLSFRGVVQQDGSTNLDIPFN